MRKPSNAAPDSNDTRYYDPELGRFIQPDNIIPDLSNPQSYNRYSYVANNPLRYTDPDGHDPLNSLFYQNMTVEQMVNSSRMSTPILVGAGVTAAVAAVAPESLPLLGRLAWAGMAGGTGGYVANGTANAMNGQPFNQNAGKATAIGVGLGVTAQGVSEVVAAIPKPTGTPTATPAPTSPSGGVKPTANPITAKPGELQTVDPNNLVAGQRQTLIRGRLDTQVQLQQSGTPRNGGPPTVYENGVINDGHHAVRAAADSGQSVTVKVIPGQGATATGKPVTELPVHEN